LEGSEIEVAGRHVNIYNAMTFGAAPKNNIAGKHNSTNHKPLAKHSGFITGQADTILVLGSLHARRYT
jgi:hypothetical protein